MSPTFNARHGETSGTGRLEARTARGARPPRIPRPPTRRPRPVAVASISNALADAPPLRVGGGGRSRSQVQETKRARLLAATIEAVDELGYAQLSVEQVVGRARASRRTFYDVFSDSEDCFLATFEHGISHARLLTGEAYRREAGWQDGIRSALARLLMLMDEEPALARLCVVEALAAGERVLELRAEALNELARVIDRGRPGAGAAHRRPPELTAECIVGAIFTVLHTRLLEDCQEPLSNLLGSLMSVIALPYRGANAASRELNRPTPEIARAQLPSRRNPLGHLNMRLTYRTVRVLSAIAEHPGSSNREIAAGSGIADDAQISRMLYRLAQLSLIENRLPGRANPNAWQLTQRGVQIERATRQH